MKIVIRKYCEIQVRNKNYGTFGIGWPAYDQYWVYEYQLAYSLYKFKNELISSTKETRGNLLRNVQKQK
jgi:hypothetical protein